MGMKAVSESEEQVWSVAEARARLPELLRLTTSAGPQRIGDKERYVLVSEEEWFARKGLPRPPLGRWLVANLSSDEELELPDRADRDRRTPLEDIG